MFRQISISLAFLNLLIFCAYGEEILIQIVVKKPINIVSDRYVSFALEPSHLLELSTTPRTAEKAKILTQKLGSSYLKIGGEPSNTFTLDDESIPLNKDQIRISPSDWMALHEWLNETNLSPVIVLPYAANQWSPRQMISILGVTDRVGINNCLWQFGAEINMTNAVNYVDGADITADSNADDVDFYAQVTKHISQANGWTQSGISSQNEVRFFTNAVLRNLRKSDVPIWLNTPLSHDQSAPTEICGNQCKLNGLKWALTLGRSAQVGFNVVFKKIDKTAFTHPSLSLYVSILHKKIMGQKVFDTKILNADKKSPHYYTHTLHENTSGSFAVMGVNLVETKTNIVTKLPTKYTGLDIHQYILTVDHGTVMLNGLPVNPNGRMEPVSSKQQPNKKENYEGVV